ncbi:MAG TPA: hypothetical protein VIQ31_11650, partial [Phormidium sp.]
SAGTKASTSFSPAPDDCPRSAVTAFQSFAPDGHNLAHMLPFQQPEPTAAYQQRYIQASALRCRRSRGEVY